MANVVGDIAVSVGADVSGLEKGMRQATRAIGNFEVNAGKLGRSIATVGVSLASIGAAAVAAGYKITSNATAAAREINNLSNIAGVSAEEFQKLAAAGEKVGFSQEKMADIFKDVNDKVGDFIATGAGPLKDFFENIAPMVGVTADQMARLSGPEALQLYVNSLEQANLSQQQMTFYMEALANDATGLIPLLKNNGSEMRRFGDEAERAGRIIGNDMIQSGVELDRKMNALASTFRNQVTAAVLENADEISNLVDVFTNSLIPAMVGVAEFAVDVANEISAIASAISSAAAEAEGFYNRVSEAAKNSGLTAHRFFGDDESQWPDWLKMLRGGRLEGKPLVTTKPLLRSGGSNRTTIDDALYGMSTGTGLDFSSGLLPPGISASVLSGGRIKPSKSGGGGKGGGGGRGDAMQDALDALRESLMSQAEQIDHWRDEQLEKLREFRDARLLTEQEFNDLEAKTLSDHQEALKRIERDAMQDRLSAFSGAFGDLASLMQSENDKLFNIGKAAALAEAVVNGYSAAVAAWDKGMKAGGPGMAAAFTAASLARTGALISGIQGTQARGGGSSGGGGGAISGGASASAPRQSPNVAVQLVGGDMYDRKQVIGLINAINEAQEDGAVIRLV